MSIQIDEKTIRVINDARGLSPLECMGLIFENILTSSEPVPKAFIAALYSGQYTFSCDPEEKSCIVTFFYSRDNNTKYIQYIFYPAYENGIDVECTNTNLEFPIYNFTVSIETLEDLMI